MEKQGPGRRLRDGLSVRGYIAFAASGRIPDMPARFDFIRMAAASRASKRLVGTHAGVEIGQVLSVVPGLSQSRNISGGTMTGARSWTWPVESWAVVVTTVQLSSHRCGSSTGRDGSGQNS